MKKLLVIPLLLVVPFLTACGSSNQLKCSREVEEAKRVLIIDFDSSRENATGVKVEYSIDFSDVKDFSEFGCEDLEDCMQMAEDEVKDCEADEYYESCKVSKKTKTSVTIEGTMTKEAVDDELKGKTYDDTKKMMEAGGYTCK